MNELATERNSPSGRRRIFDVNARGRTTDDVRDCPGERIDLGLELCTSRRLTFENGNEDGQFTCIDNRLVFCILVTAEGTKANPSLTRWRFERSTDRVSECLRKVVIQRALSISDYLHRDDGHAA